MTEFRVCNQPGCPELVDALSERRCPDHKRKTKSGTRDKRYNAEWRRVRNEHIKASPNCEHCMALGKIKPAQEVDHLYELRDGGDHDGRLVSLCRSHHSRKSAKARDLRSKGEIPPLF